MTDDTPRPAGAGVYQAFWRWHFYAGLLVLPFLMLLALTGGIYLFHQDIDAALRRDLERVPARPVATTPADWAVAAGSVADGRLAQVIPPFQPGQAARLVVQGESRTTVYIDPADGAVLGVVRDGGFTNWIMKLHSLEHFGKVANLLVEIVAGWAIVLVATGIYLWWPRGQAGGVVTVRGRPGKRLFWRDLHAVTGVFAGAVIVFLAVTGMPWSQVWGDNVRQMVNANGWGRPKPPAASTWTPGPAAGAKGGLPWALQDGDLAAAGHDLSLNQAVAKALASDLPRPFTLSIPAEPDKAWTVSHTANQVEATRTLYLSPRDGRVVADVGFDRFGPGAKAIEWGITVHQGEQYGWINRYLMLAGCVAIWLLGISAVTMWWKRRPKGRLAAPGRPANPGSYLGLAAVVAPLAILYPLVGATMIAALGLDLVLRRVIPAFGFRSTP